MPWIRIDVGMPRHAKVRDLEEELGDHNAGMYLIRLWAWVGEYYPTGIVPVSGKRIEDAAEWKAKSGKLLEVLLGLRFIEKTGEKEFTFHGWDEHNGAAYRKMEDDRQRARENRAAKKSDAEASATETSTRTRTRTRPRTDREPEQEPDPERVGGASHVTDVTDGRNVRTNVDPPNPPTGDSAAGAALDTPPPAPASAPRARPTLYRERHEVPAAAIQQVHDAIVEHFKPRRMPGTQGMDFIRRRLHEEQISAEDWCNAIRGYAADGFWNGTKAGSQRKLNYYDLFKDPKGFDRGLDLWDQQQNPRPQAPEEKPAPTRVHYAPPAGVIPPVIEDIRAHLQLGPTISQEEARKVLAKHPRPRWISEPEGEKAVA
jgi:hypothetical protein